MLGIHQKAPCRALLPQPDVANGFGVELAFEDRVVAQNRAEHAGVCDVHRIAVAHCVFEGALEVGVCGVVGERQVVASDQIRSEHGAASGAGQGGEGPQVGYRERVTDDLEKPVLFAERLEHGQLHLGEEAGGGYDVEVVAEARHERLGRDVRVTDELFGGELKALPAIESGQHAGEIDRGMTGQSVAVGSCDACTRLIERDGVEVHQVDFAVVLEQGIELDVVAVACAKDADRLGRLRGCPAQELARQVLAVVGVERRMRERALIRKALFVDFVIEPGGHAGLG